MQSERRPKAGLRPDRLRLHIGGSGVGWGGEEVSAAYALGAESLLDDLGGPTRTEDRPAACGSIMWEQHVGAAR